MTASDSYPAGIDPVHVRTIATAAVPDGQRDGTVLLVGGQYAARVYLPTRSAAQAAHAALRRVGYQVGRTGSLRGRDLIIAGWSAEGLESRLTAMRAVLQKLAAEPGAAAVAALDQLGRLSAAALPGQAGQRLLIHQADQQLRAWIADTSGIHAPCDPRARPADPGCALRLNATHRAEEAIDDLAARHVQVAELAVALYPALRQRMDHDSASDFAVRRAGVAFHLSQQLAQDITPLLRGSGHTPGRRDRGQAPGPGCGLPGNSRLPACRFRRLPGHPPPEERPARAAGTSPPAARVGAADHGVRRPRPEMPGGAPSKPIARTQKARRESGDERRNPP